MDDTGSLVSIRLNGIQKVFTSNPGIPFIVNLRIRF